MTFLTDHKDGKRVPITSHRVLLNGSDVTAITHSVNDDEKSGYVKLYVITVLPDGRVERIKDYLGMDLTFLVYGRVNLFPAMPGDEVIHASRD